MKKLVVGWVFFTMVMPIFLLAGEVAGPSEAPPSTQAPAMTAKPVRQLMEQAQIYQADEKWKDAVKSFEEAYRQDPTNDAVIFGLGTSLSQVGRYKEALELLLGLLKKNPDHPSVQNNVAWIYAKSTDPEVKDPKLALRYARRALMITPSDYNIWSTLAEAYWASGDYQRAFRVARQSYQLARVSGETNLGPIRELVERCRRAAGVAAANETEEDR